MTRTVRPDRPARSLRRAAAATGTGLAVALLLAGCGGVGSAGSAAVLGDSRVTTEQVAEQVAAVHRANGVPVDQVDEELTRGTVERLTTLNLVDQAAARLGVEVTQGQIDQALSSYDAQLGGRENVEKAFLDSGVPPEAIEETVTLSLQAEGMGLALAPNGTPEDQQKAVFDYVIRLSDELDVTVSPRFGTWVPDALRVGPRPTDLAVPVAQEELAGGLPSGEQPSGEQPSGEQPAPEQSPSPQAS